MNEDTPTFFRFTFTAETLCIGERLKKGTFRPCIEVLPCSTVMGMLFSHLGWISESDEEPFPICAVGGQLGFAKENRETLTFAPSDIAVGKSKLPLTVEFLSHVVGEFFVKKTTAIPDADYIMKRLKKKRFFYLGAFKSKGFGLCEIAKTETYQPQTIHTEGRLNSRLYDIPEFVKLFGVERIVKPRYGYLFKKESMEGGFYQRSLFEKTKILGGFDFIMEEHYGRGNANQDG